MQKNQTLPKDMTRIGDSMGTWHIILSTPHNFVDDMCAS